MGERMTAAEYRAKYSGGKQDKKAHATRGHVRGQWVEVPGKKKFYCRSTYEANRARALQGLKQLGVIQDFEHEPKKFEFPGIKGKNYCYTPDFKVTRLDGSHYWEETKGWMDNDSKIKLKRMAKYFSGEEIQVLTQR